jgi:serine/threonine protein kinase
MVELYDEDVPEKIQEFLKNNADIEVTERVVRGLNGILYFGKRTKLGDEVALKFYLAGKDYDDTEEAVILRQIKHKHILEIYDLKFVPPYYPYFLTPKISGGDLQGIIDDRKLSSKEALNIIDGILKGLNAMHSAHGLVHRDLKPGNILIDLKDNCPIIADLGAVKKLNDPNGHVTASKSTYLYLPPESVSKNEFYFQSDIYQVGVIMYQILGGYFPINDPYKCLNNKELIKVSATRGERQKVEVFNRIIETKISRGTLIDTKTMPYYLDDAVRRVVNKATHLDYRKRYANPALFLKDVHNLIRTCPDYIEEDHRVMISHENGKCFRITPSTAGQTVFEKKMPGKEWRRDNGHRGNLDLALNIARAK